MMSSDETGRRLLSSRLHGDIGSFDVSDCYKCTLLIEQKSNFFSQSLTLRYSHVTIVRLNHLDSLLVCG